MPTPTRTLESDPRWFKPDLDEAAFSAEVVFQPITFLRDAKAAHQLLDLVVLTACFLDRIEEDGDAGAPLKIQAATLRDAIAPWVPIPEALAAPISYGAWIGRIMGLQDTVLQAAPISPDGLSILAQERAEEQLRLVQADADHLRVVLAQERAESREDFRLMRSAAATMADGTAGFKLLGSLLDRARNWVQDPELRAEITKHCPPAPRTAADA